jgi:hypothetical protein
MDDHEELVALTDKMSALGAGYKDHVFLQATLSVLTMVVVDACDTLDEAEATVGELAKGLVEAIRNCWAADHPH